MSSCCPSARSHVSSMHLDMCASVSVCACAWRGKEGRSPKSPGRIMKVNGSQMDCFSSFSLCCQWREESDKPLMGNRLAHCSFELLADSIESSFSQSPDSTTFFPNNKSIKDNFIYWKSTKKLASIRADKTTIWLCWAGLCSSSSAASPTEETIVLCQLCSGCWVWDQPVRRFTCHVNDFFRFNGKYLSCVQFGHAQLCLKTAIFHWMLGPVFISTLMKWIHTEVLLSAVYLNIESTEMETTAGSSLLFITLCPVSAT